ncbi:MAG: 50S ribosomal protein L17 [Deltaproteobacteria bacterium]|nr:50S ribosomal protein L17 [Deltaproteobacteria bacterium]
MRHRKAGKKLGRSSSHRRAMLRNLVTSLFRHEQVETTDAKAKEAKPIAEKMVGLAKRGDLHARRQALSYMRDKGVTHKLFEEIKDRFLDRQGGYLRIVKKAKRRGDGAPISIIQLLPGEGAKKKEKKKTKDAGAGSKAASKDKKESQKGENKERERAVNTKERDQGRADAPVVEGDKGSM